MILSSGPGSLHGDGQGVLSTQSPQTCGPRAAVLQTPDQNLGFTLVRLEEVLRDFEHRQVESLSQIRKLVEVIASQNVAELNAAQQPSSAAQQPSSAPQQPSGVPDSVQDKLAVPAAAPVDHVELNRSNNRIQVFLQEEEDEGDQIGTKGSCARLSYRVRKLLNSPGFDYLVGAIILLNSAIMGLRTQHDLEGRKEAWIDWSEHFFLATYCFELALRIIGYGFECLRTKWVAFDAALVCVGVISQWIAGPIKKASSGDTLFLEKLLVFRLLRILRLLRALHMFDAFKNAWLLAHGLLTSGSNIISVFGLLVIVLYMFTLAGIEIITKDSELTSHPKVGYIIQENFNSVPGFMLTLSQFVLADSVASLYRPLIDAKPRLIMFFVPLMLVVSVSLMNLVTAVIVECALANASRDRELEIKATRERVRKLAPIFENLFQELDDDDSGVISTDEVKKIRVDDMPPEAADRVDAESMLELSQILDVDGSGEVSKDEFVHGMINLCLESDVPKELLLVLKLTRVQMRSIVDVQRRLCEFDKSLCEFDKNIKRAQRDQAETQGNYSSVVKSSL